MTDLTRRGFLIGMSAAGALVAAGLPVEGEAYPILYGDGEHDDAPALTALFSGKKVLCRNDGIVIHQQPGQVILRGGDYYLGSPVSLPAGSIGIQDSIWRLAPRSKMPLPGIDVDGTWLGYDLLGAET